MNVPETFNIQNFQVSTFGIFLFLGFMFSLFALWNEGRKDAFDEEKLFDVFVVSLVAGIFTGRIFYSLQFFEGFENFFNSVIRFWVPGIDLYGLFIGTLLSAYLILKRWKWSIYRVFDIYALSLAFGFAVVVLGFVALQKNFEFLFVFAIFLLFYAIFSKYRNYKVKSGLTFSFFLILGAGVGAFVFNDSRYLPFYALLVTISLVTFYFRMRKTLMSTSLSKNFIEQMKKRLQKKDAQLAAEQEQLIKEDPYLDEDREDDNSEMVDDAYEDIGHTNVQARLSLIERSRSQVQKALNRIKEGKYGVSEVSGKPIPEERLEAYPEATTLVDEESNEEQQ